MRILLVAVLVSETAVASFTKKSFVGKGWHLVGSCGTVETGGEGLLQPFLKPESSHRQGFGRSSTIFLR